MTVSITLEQTQTDEEGATPDVPLYRVTNEVVASEGISLALFVFETANDSFSHVATPRDLETYAPDKNTAALEGTTYYRAALASLDFTRIEDAASFATIVRARLTALPNTYQQALSTFTGVETYVFTGN